MQVRTRLMGRYAVCNVACRAWSKIMTTTFLIVNSPNADQFSQVALRLSSKFIITSSLNVMLWMCGTISLTSCCSTNSERPHRCFHVANNFCWHRISPQCFTIGREMHRPIIAPFPGGPGPHLAHGSLGLHESRIHLDWFIQFNTAYSCDR